MNMKRQSIFITSIVILGLVLSPVAGYATFMGADGPITDGFDTDALRGFDQTGDDPSSSSLGEGFGDDVGVNNSHTSAEPEKTTQEQASESDEPGPLEEDWLAFVNDPNVQRVLHDDPIQFASALLAFFFYVEGGGMTQIDYPKMETDEERYKREGHPDVDSVVDDLQPIVILDQEGIGPRGSMFPRSGDRKDSATSDPEPESDLNEYGVESVINDLQPMVVGS